MLCGCRRIRFDELFADWHGRGKLVPAWRCDLAGGALPVTAAWYDPGQYAWQSHAHGEHMSGNQRQAIDARLAQQVAEGSVHTAGSPHSPATDDAMERCVWGKLDGQRYGKLTLEERELNKAVAG